MKNKFKSKWSKFLNRQWLGLQWKHVLKAAHKKFVQSKMIILGVYGGGKNQSWLQKDADTKGGGQVEQQRLYLEREINFLSEN